MCSFIDEWLTSLKCLCLYLCLLYNKRIRRIAALPLWAGEIRTECKEVNKRDCI